MPQIDPISINPQETALLGGGCFWCLEPLFDNLKGVESVESGYAGGKIVNPTYKDVCTGKTGHAEVIKIGFDCNIISYKEILDVFFTIHDPTTLNRQGNDVGTQYRSIIFYYSLEQKTTAETTILQLEKDKSWKEPIVTAVAPAPVFYPAEDYHQSYFRQNGYQPYCQMVIAPKVAKFRRTFFNKLKNE